MGSAGLAARTVIVTGGATGIGVAIATSAARAGATYAANKAIVDLSAAQSAITENNE